jgi:hypothetical protein
MIESIKARGNMIPRAFIFYCKTNKTPEKGKKKGSFYKLPQSHENN